MGTPSASSRAGRHRQPGHEALSKSQAISLGGPPPGPGRWLSRRDTRRRLLAGCRPITSTSRATIPVREPPRADTRSVLMDQGSGRQGRPCGAIGRASCSPDAPAYTRCSWRRRRRAWSGQGLDRRPARAQKRRKRSQRSRPGVTGQPAARDCPETGDARAMAPVGLRLTHKMTTSSTCGFGSIPVAIIMQAIGASKRIDFG